jgi:hypothetical protein
MENTVHNDNETVELVEVTQARLAEVTGGWGAPFRTADVVEYSGTTYLGVTGATLGPAPINSTRTP